MPKRVCPGVFFDPPETLPRGRHGLPREAVHAAQRERVMSAFTELMADRGWAGVRVNDIATRAGVSLEAFYELYEDKQACAFAAYDRFIEVLVRRVAASLPPAKDWRQFVHGEVEAYFSALSADPVVARAILLEMDALGAEARRRRRHSLMRFAVVSHNAETALRKIDKQLVGMPLHIHLAHIYAVRQLACDALDDHAVPDFDAMAPDLVDWIVTAAYGGRPRKPAPRRKAAVRARPGRA
jgi:AcrR family transcriptional regulator